jgi:SOS response regulatory protein OraA/RecX
MDREQEQAYCLNARRRAMDLLARREHSRRELFGKLRTRLKAASVALSKTALSAAALSETAQSEIAPSDDLNNGDDLADVSTNTDALINRVLDQLEKDGLLSDARYVESYVSARRHKGFGPMYIRHQLRSRDVDEQGMAFVSDVAEAQWLDALLLLLRKRLSSGCFPQRASKEYLKLQRFVLSRGYAMSQWLQAEQLYRSE